MSRLNRIGKAPAITGPGLPKSYVDAQKAEAVRKEREADFLVWEAARREREAAEKLEADKAYWLSLNETERAVCRKLDRGFARRCEG